jgi:predicted GTPase
MSVREVAPGAGADEVRRWLVERGLDHDGLDVAVIDALRPELAGGAADADVVVVTRADLASEDALRAIRALVGAAETVPVATPVELEHGPPLLDAAVVVVEDEATLAAGLPFGAATLAALDAHVGMRIDPTEFTAGPVADVLDAIECDAVIAAGPLPLRTRHPVRRARFVVRDDEGALERALARARRRAKVPA